MAGWIKLHRKMMEWAHYGDSDYVAFWIHLLLSASHKPIKKCFGKETITVNAGQLISSRCSLAAATGINEHKIDRMLTRLQSEQQIEQQTCSTSRLITITKWKEYQQDEQQNEQQVSSDRAASEQRVSTNNNNKIEQEIKKESKPSTPAAPAWKWWIDVNRAMGRKDPVAIGKDTAASRALGKAIHTEIECKEIMRRFLMDTDPYLQKSGYPLSLLLQRINKYNTPAATSGDTSPYKRLA